MRLRMIYENQKVGSNAYKIQSGSVFTEQFNETLDSCILNITNVEPSEKLELEPYQSVYIYDLDSDFKRYYLVDNFIEKYVNIDTPYYDYQINCFSETKLLEKIQLPNRTIRQSKIESKKKTIQQYLKEFLTLYIPKVKEKYLTNKWTYNYLIDFTSVINDSKFDVLCPEMTFNNQTLRSVITSLMNVVGCIPTITNKTLSYLDLRQATTEFKIYDNRKYDIVQSNSSDSYLNSITTLCDNIIGDDNKVKNEIIGFRDSENVFLKHDDNLKITLENSIESVEKMEMCFNACCGMELSLTPFFQYNSGYGGIYLMKNSNGTFKYIQKAANPTLGNLKIDSYKIEYYKGGVSSIEHEIIAYGEIKITKALNTNGGTLVYSLNGGSFYLYGKGTTDYYYSDNFGSLNDIDYDYCKIYLYIDGNCYIDIGFKENSMTDSGGNQYSNGTYFGFDCPFMWAYDIKSLVYEKSARKCLRTDITCSPKTIEEMSQYYYTTLEYEYGSNTIDGFSQKYEWVEWYGTYGEILITNLKEILVAKYPFGAYLTKDTFIKCLGLGNYKSQLRLISYYNVVNDAFISSNPIINIYDKGSSYSPYTLIYFNITYKPFNSLNLVFNKEKDCYFNLTQLDNQETSIPALSSFASREQEKTNRIANNVLKIHASQITDLNKINPLNSSYNGNVVFSREIAIYDDFFDVNYTLTKDYVMKTYFTSITTKYRAFEYVDYNSTTLRKENKKFYVYLSDKYFNGDDRILTSNYTEKNNRENLNNLFLNFMIGNSLNFVEDNLIEDFDYSIKGTNESSDYSLFKNDLSIVKYGNTYTLAYRDFDSVSGGIYIENPEKIEALGGYTQGWYMREDNYSDTNRTIFTDYRLIPKNNSNVDYVLNDMVDLENYYEISLELPKIRTSLFNPSTYTGSMLAIVDNNSSDSELCSYYKQSDEVLSETIQFEYVSGNENIVIGNHLVDFNTILGVGTQAQIYIALKGYNKDFDTIYSISSSNLTPTWNVFTRNSDNSITINWSNIKTSEIMLVAQYGSKVINLMKITNGISKIQVSLNDTRTLKVFEDNITFKDENGYKFSPLLSPTKTVVINDSEERECE